MVKESAGAVEVFCVYAPKDQAFAKELEEHLDNLQRQGLIAGWYGRDITAAEEKTSDIALHLRRAAVVLLLVSSSFINSQYCYGDELKQLMKRRNESQDVWVIPIIVRPCDWRGTPFENIMALPRNGQPVSKWPDHDEAFIDIMNDFRQVLQHLAMR